MGDLVDSAVCWALILGWDRWGSLDKCEFPSRDGAYSTARGAGDEVGGPLGCSFGSGNGDDGGQVNASISLRV